MHSSWCIMQVMDEDGDDGDEKRDKSYTSDATAMRMIHADEEEERKKL